MSLIESIWLRLLDDCQGVICWLYNEWIVSSVKVANQISTGITVLWDYWCIRFPCFWVYLNSTICIQCLFWFKACLISRWVSPKRKFSIWNDFLHAITIGIINCHWVYTWIVNVLFEHIHVHLIDQDIGVQDCIIKWKSAVVLSTQIHIQLLESYAHIVYWYFLCVSDEGIIPWIQHECRHVIFTIWNELWVFWSTVAAERRNHMKFIADCKLNVVAVILSLCFLLIVLLYSIFRKYQISYQFGYLFDICHHKKGSLGAYCWLISI